ncbi:signal peptidase I [candidate division KSB1 bacterium]|nr:MAG: signal peptidase I [candidate division KSB1 bacterium]
MRAKGFSMYPFIKEGDLVTLGRIDLARIRVGDVIALPHPEEGKLIIHRVVRIDRDHLKTKGDHNPVSDGWIERESILAIVLRVQRTEKEVKQAHVVVQRLIVLLSRFLRTPRVRLKLYKTLLIRGERY